MHINQLQTVSEYILKIVPPENIDKALEIKRRLASIGSRHTEITNQVDSYLAERSHVQNDTIISQGISIRFPRVDPNVPVRLVSQSTFGAASALSSNALTILNLVEAQYAEMFRVIEICRNENSLNSIKAKGVEVTHNELIKHAGTKPKSIVTYDSFSIESARGPVIKGLRRQEQKDELSGYGVYYDEFEEFLNSLVKLESNLS